MTLQLLLEARFSLFLRNGYPLRVQGSQVYSSGCYCKAVKTAWSPRHPFRPCGKTCTPSFRGDAWQNAILPRFTDNRRMKVFCDKIIVKREVTAQNTLRLRDAITKQYSFVEKAPFRRFQTSAP